MARGEAFPRNVEQRKTVEIVVPVGYVSPDEFLSIWRFERASRPAIASTQEMRDRLRELRSAVSIVLDDLERIIQRYDL